MTECTQERFEFAAHFSRRVVAQFSADQLATDGGSPLLRQVDRRIGLLRRFARCFRDRRDPRRIELSVAEMVAQRVYALALGYEDLIDHEQLRHDPLLAVLAGKRELDSPLAGKSTLNRLELSRAAQPPRYHKISYARGDRSSAGRSVSGIAPRAPRQIVLDLDSTDIPLHGHQERFFHGYYNSYCYLPLYIFAGDHLLCARLRPADQDGAAGAVEEVERIVGQIRQRWPRVEIVVRADSGFCREELMHWCEQNRVHYILGLGAQRPTTSITGAADARGAAAVMRQPASRAGLHRVPLPHPPELEPLAQGDRQGRVHPGRKIPRFIVTSLEGGDAQALYEKLYCARGEMENRIKEQLCLFADRLSTENARQSTAPVPVGDGLHPVGSTAPLGLAWNRVGRSSGRHHPAEADENRAQVRITARRIRLQFHSAYPWQDVFAAACHALRC